MARQRKGNGQIDKSVTTAELKAEVVKVRSAGHSFAEVARRIPGVYDASHASKLYRQALADVPADGVHEIRAQELTRMESMDTYLAGIIENPPAALTAAGKIVYQPGTERYAMNDDGTIFLDKRYNRPVIIGGDPVVDQSVVIRAISERRKISESYRKMTGADEPAQVTIRSDQQLEAQRSIEALKQLAQMRPDLVRYAIDQAQPQAIPGHVEPE